MDLPEARSDSAPPVPCPAVSYSTTCILASGSCFVNGIHTPRGRTEIVARRQSSTAARDRPRETEENILIRQGTKPAAAPAPPRRHTGGLDS